MSNYICPNQLMNNFKNALEVDKRKLNKNKKKNEHCKTTRYIVYLKPLHATVQTFAVRETDVSRHDGGTSGVPLKPLRDDSALSRQSIAPSSNSYRHDSHSTLRFVYVIFISCSAISTMKKKPISRSSLWPWKLLVCDNDQSAQCFAKQTCCPISHHFRTYTRDVWQWQIY